MMIKVDQGLYMTKYIGRKDGHSHNFGHLHLRGKMKKQRETKQTRGTERKLREETKQ